MARKIQITVAGNSLPNLKVAIGLQTDETENGPLTLLALSFYKDLTAFLQKMVDNPFPGKDQEEDITIFFEDDVEDDEEEDEWDEEDDFDEAELPEQVDAPELEFK